MSPPDAQSYWASAAIPNDQFLLYCFAAPDFSLADSAGSGRSAALSALASEVRSRAAGVADLRLRVLDVPASLDRPYWIDGDIGDDQVRVHRVGGWPECLDVLGRLMAEQLTPSQCCWRVHLFGPITDAPGAHEGGAGEPAVIAVLQITHALGDGRRTSSIARELFGDGPTIPPGPGGFDRGVVDRSGGRRTGGGAPGSGRAAGLFLLSAAAWGAARFPVDLAATVGKGLSAYRLAKQAPPPGDGVPLSSLNRQPGDDRILRTIVVPRESLKPFGHNVTVGALTAISLALPEYLDDADRRYAVELTVGRDPATVSGTRNRRQPRNDFRNCSIGLHADEADLAARAGAIRADIAAARDADRDPARAASRAASAAAPPILTHWGIRQFDPTVRPDTVTGLTVVSSVDRGAADLSLAGGRVRFTAGFPALSPAQGLTHGVHGIGDTVALSVTTSAAVCPDVDRYIAMLSAALDRLPVG